MALWSLLGPRGVEVLAWESFGRGWAKDITAELKLSDVQVRAADYGHLPDLDSVEFDRDVVFTWNGTTSGVRVPDGEWIPADRQGLTICDATSAAFAVDLPWDKLDVATYSWQKVLGGEAAHGVLVLGPRAVERLESHDPPWPLPKIFRLKKSGALNEAIFAGSTINTPSMLCVEDYLDALTWADELGGLDALIRQANRNLDVLAAWVGETEWIDFLAVDPRTRSNTSVCLRIVDPAFTVRPLSEQAELTKAMAGALADEGVAYDVGAYRDAPPGLRIWTGPTVAEDDLRALLPWLQWAFDRFAGPVAV